MKNYITIFMLFFFNMFSTNLLAQESNISDEEKKQALANTKQIVSYIKDSNIDALWELTEDKKRESRSSLEEICNSWKNSLLENSFDESRVEFYMEEDFGFSDDSLLIVIIPSQVKQGASSIPTVHFMSLWDKDRLLFLAIEMDGWFFKSSDFNRIVYGKSKKVLSYIQQSDIEGFRSVLHSSLEAITDDQIEAGFRPFKYILDNYTPPSDISQVEIKNHEVNIQQEDFSLEGDIYLIELPYVSKNNSDSVRHITLTLFDGLELMGLNIYDPNKKSEILIPEPSQPHLDAFNLQFKDVSWFRIWYSNGYRKDKRINEQYYYAVTGGKFSFGSRGDDAKGQINDYLDPEGENSESMNTVETALDSLISIGSAVLSRSDNETLLKDEKVQEMMQDLFDQINKAKIDSIDYMYLDDQEMSNPEDIYLRIDFSNDEYKNMGEFQIKCVLTDEPGTKENSSDYIIVKHSQQTRYLLSKAKNPKLFAALRRLADYDWGDNYEENP